MCPITGISNGPPMQMIAKVTLFAALMVSGAASASRLAEPVAFPPLERLVSDAAPTPRFLPGAGAESVVSRTIGVRGGWEVVGTYVWNGHVWQLSGFELKPAPQRKSGARSAQSLQGAGDDAYSIQPDPSTPRDPGRPTVAGYIGQTTSSSFTTAGWRYTISYAYGVNSHGVLGWHITEIRATLVAPIRPPVSTQ